MLSSGFQLETNKFTEVKLCMGSAVISHYVELDQAWEFNSANGSVSSGSVVM